MENGIKAGEEIKHLRACIVDQADNQITINHQADDIAAFRQQVEEYKAFWDQARLANQMLENLLAIIHRDGGHYTSEHGLEKSVKDAQKKVAEATNERP
uniref:Uncharacterized protein n=1 Tax=viral metagenome TaxID=1070528 RepID=A0A6M3K0Y8_9ZZZZ